MRNAPARSFFRHSGLRMIVFAVNERRSPAERTKRELRVRPRRGSLARPSSSSNSSGIASWMRPFGVVTRAKLSSHSSTENMTALLLASIASKRASAASGGEPVKPARASDGAILARARSGRSPRRRALGESLGQQVADRAIEQRRARSRQAADLRAMQLEELRAEGHAALVPGCAQLRDGVLRQRAERLGEARVQLRLGEQSRQGRHQGLAQVEVVVAGTRS